MANMLIDVTLIFIGYSELVIPLKELNFKKFLRLPYKLHKMHHFDLARFAYKIRLLFSVIREKQSLPWSFNFCILSRCCAASFSYVTFSFARRFTTPVLILSVLTRGSDIIFVCLHGNFSDPTKKSVEGFRKASSAR